MDFVEVVKNKIKKNGLKQIFLADKIGLAIDSFSKSLKGQRKFKTDEIFKLANILNIDLNQFKEA
ncbi:helix-turn-helix transcriptional regulator [bacterium]|nr:helix-turn-helix transcriptional regulator [bacterium]